MDVSATSTRMSKLTSDHKPLLTVDHLEVSNLHSVAKNREVSIAIKEEEVEEIGESDLGKREEKTNDDTVKEKEEEREDPAFEDKCVNGQAESDPEISSDKSGLLTTHLWLLPMSDVSELAWVRLWRLTLGALSVIL